MATISYIRKPFYAPAVNLAASATTIIVPAISGAVFIPKQMYARLTQNPGAGTQASFTVGVSGATFPLVASTTVPLLTTAGQMFEIALNGTSVVQGQNISTNGIGITVTAGTKTTYTADFFLEGFIL
jgi:hypothetical protein